MKALITKDCYVLSKQIKIFSVMVLIFSFLPGMSVAIFTIIYASMLPLSALAYDEQSKWDQLAAMLPYSSQNLVASKYVLGYLFAAATSAGTFAVQFLVQPFTQTHVSLGSALLSFCLATLLTALILPFIFRFGVEKGRTLSLVLIVSAATVFSFPLSASTDIHSFPISAALYLGIPTVAVLANFFSLWLSTGMYTRRNR